MTYITRFGYDKTEHAAKFEKNLPQESLVQQSMKDEADINVLVRRFGLTGHIQAPVRLPLPADFIEALTYQEALNAVLEAQESFSALDADLRRRFDNDPRHFVDFVADPENLDELRRLGLAPEAATPSLPADDGPAPESSEPASGEA